MSLAIRQGVVGKYPTAPQESQVSTFKGVPDSRGLFNSINPSVLEGSSIQTNIPSTRKLPGDNKKELALFNNDKDFDTTDLKLAQEEKMANNGGISPLANIIGAIGNFFSGNAQIVKDNQAQNDKNPAPEYNQSNAKGNETLAKNDNKDKGNSAAAIAYDTDKAQDTDKGQSAAAIAYSINANEKNNKGNSAAAIAYNGTNSQEADKGNSAAAIALGNCESIAFGAITTGAFGGFASSSFDCGSADSGCSDSGSCSDGGMAV